MDGEADGLVHDRLAGAVDGDARAEPRDHRRHAVHPPLGQEKAFGLVQTASGERSHHHFAFGDEAAVPAGDVAIAQAAEHFEAGIAWIADRNYCRNRHAGPALARARQRRWGVSHGFGCRR